jgi:aspartate racemase
MKTVGIIGGLGPETTSKFYLELIFSSFEKNKENRPPILMWSIPLPYEIESNLITKASGEEAYIPFMVDAAQRLEKGGADFLVIPCNSVHIFIEEVRQAVSIPVLSIIEETTAFLKEKNVAEVGILSTTTVIKHKLYENLFETNGIMQKVPNEDEQTQVGKIINNLVLNQHSNEDKEVLMRIIGNFEQRGIKKIILACTDLQLLIPKHDGVEIYDTMEILAQATVKNILG